MMIDGIRGIARRSFNGDTRKGSRRDYILKELRRRGCHPEVDKYGNIWVEKGKGFPVVLFSSHMDVDPRIRRIKFGCKKSKKGIILTGALDNAVGCYINLLLAQRGPKNGKAIYIFTASEEVARRSGRTFARSAREVVGELQRKSIRPRVCIAIDVTYPRLLHPQHRLDWSKEYEELFDINDTTHCYIDGFYGRSAKRIVASYTRKFHNLNIRLRDFRGHDEAFVYARMSPSFAFGPVVYGHFDRPDQHMPFSHLLTALRFLRNV